MRNLNLLALILLITFGFTSCYEKTDKLPDQSKEDEEYIHEKLADEEPEEGGKPVKPVGGYDYYEEQTLKEEVKLGQDTLKLLVEEYLKLKEALVEANDELSARYSQNIVDIIDTMRQKKSIFPISEAAYAISQSKHINEKRAAFYPLSSLYASLLSYNKPENTLYKQYCPMAFDNKGAYWISETYEIRNPYFGDEMLNCGETQKEY